MLPLFENLKVTEPIENVFIGEMIIKGRKSFPPGLIKDIHDFFIFVSNKENKNGQNRFLVLKGEEGSDVFNFGGDLNLFLDLVEKKDIASLKLYGKQCIDIEYMSLKAKYNQMTTVAVLNGETRGGGLEAALACDIIIGEKGYLVSLPETKLGFFPGMGAFEFLTKKIGVRKAKEFILSGESFSNEELYEKGIIDFLSEKGQSHNDLLNVIKKERKEQSKFNSIRKIEDRLSPITYEELMDSVSIWSECIVNISESNKRFIKKMISLQNNK
jgi:DSF synthase